MLLCCIASTSSSRGGLQTSSSRYLFWQTYQRPFDSNNLFYWTLGDPISRLFSSVDRKSVLLALLQLYIFRSLEPRLDLGIWLEVITTSVINPFWKLPFCSVYRWYAALPNDECRLRLIFCLQYVPRLQICDWLKLFGLLLICALMWGDIFSLQVYIKWKMRNCSINRITNSVTKSCSIILRSIRVLKDRLIVHDYDLRIPLVLYGFISAFITCFLQIL